MDVSCADKILDTNEKVFGIIYKITNVEDGKIYIGQTHSHRLNKGKYRPYGAVSRFNCHINTAINNTSTSQSSYLYNAIRKHGKDKFKLETVTVCPKEDLDIFEQKYIRDLGTLYPDGYNLTTGGKSARFVAPSQLDKLALRPPRKRGGCKFRSEETRAKMSARGQELLTPELIESRRKNVITQHHTSKLERFKDCKVDLTKIDSYIRKKGKRYDVVIGEARTSFTSKHETPDKVRERAVAFINEIHNATLSNCGKPVKPE
jgi:group I intron endonuclease